MQRRRRAFQRRHLLRRYELPIGCGGAASMPSGLNDTWTDTATLSVRLMPAGRDEHELTRSRNTVAKFGATSGESMAGASIPPPNCPPAIASRAKVSAVSSSGVVAGCGCGKGGGAAVRGIRRLGFCRIGLLRLGMSRLQLPDLGLCHLRRLGLRLRLLIRLRRRLTSVALRVRTLRLLRRLCGRFRRPRLRGAA